jgi:hypothetical protein
MRSKPLWYPTIFLIVMFHLGFDKFIQAWEPTLKVHLISSMSIRSKPLWYPTNFQIVVFHLGFDKLIQAWKPTLRVHLITSMSIRSLPYWYSTSFQSVTSHSKWEFSKTKLQIDLKPSEFWHLLNINNSNLVQGQVDMEVFKRPNIMIKLISIFFKPSNIGTKFVCWTM